MSGELSSNSSNTESSDNTALRKELSSKEQRSSEWANKYRSRKGVGREGIPEITVHTYYKINFTNQLGQGASGRVFQAWRRSDGLPVAVKIMHQKLLADHDNRQALENEISILKELECDNIIKLYDTFEDRYNFYLVLELVTGGELFFRIEARQGYCELDGRELCRCILTALNYIHERGIVHRDIKPENLLMASKDDDVTVKLCDFGFSERVSGDSLTGSLGTPLYMAPEIWSGRNYGLAIDMWSFGCLAYIILCGYPPFYDTDLAVLYALVSRGELIFHEEFWGPVSAAAKDFVSRLLTVDPAQRMTAAQALQHPWLQVDRQTLRGRELPAKTQLRTFNARERIKQALTSFAALRRVKKRFTTASAALLEMRSPRSPAKHRSAAAEGEEETIYNVVHSATTAATTRATDLEGSRVQSINESAGLQGALWVHAHLRFVRRCGVLRGGLFCLYATDSCEALLVRPLREIDLRSYTVSLDGDNKQLVLFDCMGRGRGDLRIECREPSGPSLQQWYEALQQHITYALVHPRDTRHSSVGDRRVSSDGAGPLLHSVNRDGTARNSLLEPAGVGVRRARVLHVAVDMYQVSAGFSTTVQLEARRWHRSERDKQSLPSCLLACLRGCTEDGCGIALSLQFMRTVTAGLVAESFDRALSRCHVKSSRAFVAAVSALVGEQLRAGDSLQFYWLYGGGLIVVAVAVDGDAGASGAYRHARVPFADPDVEKQLLETYLCPLRTVSPELYRDVVRHLVEAEASEGMNGSPARSGSNKSTGSGEENPLGSNMRRISAHVPFPLVRLALSAIDKHRSLAHSSGGGRRGKEKTEDKIGISVDTSSAPPLPSLDSGTITGVSSPLRYFPLAASTVYKVRQRYQSSEGSAPTRVLSPSRTSSEQ